MPEWEEPKYQNLLAPSIWLTNYEEIKKILAMPEWEDPKYQSLLTPNIWHTNYEEIKKILDMPEWSNPKYQSLLTPTIWKTKFEKINNIIHMPELDNPKYAHLLKVTMLNINIKKIREIIALFEELGLSDYLTNNIFVRSIKQTKAIYDYLIENNIPVIINGKLNPLFNCSKAIMLKRYGINLDELMNRDGVKR